MQIIPVLDIMGGVVVRGTGGDRAAYRPIETPLAESADPVAVAKGLSRFGRFAAFYVADLDAIEGRPDNEAVVAELQDAFPQTEFWVDSGLRKAACGAQAKKIPGRVTVAGSESLESAAELTRLGDVERVLSLDFRGDTFLGDPAILVDRTHWPERLIVMTLARVGSGKGPDLDRLVEVAGLAGGRAIFAAGGVRGEQDLQALSRAGVAGALVSTALHDGRLSTDVLNRLGS